MGVRACVFADQGTLPPTILEAQRRVLKAYFPFGEPPVHFHDCRKRGYVSEQFLLVWISRSPPKMVGFPVKKNGAKTKTRTPGRFGGKPQKMWLRRNLRGAVLLGTVSAWCEGKPNWQPQFVGVQIIILIRVIVFYTPRKKKKNSNQQSRGFKTDFQVCVVRCSYLSLFSVQTDFLSICVQNGWPILNPLGIVPELPNHCCFLGSS